VICCWAARRADEQAMRRYGNIGKFGLHGDLLNQYAPRSGVTTENRNPPRW